MSKKLKILVILTLIIQLIIPSYLLYHHYSVTEAAINSGTEYKFRISYIEFDAADAQSKEECKSIHFFLDGLSGLYKSKIAVSADEYGFATMSELKNKNQTDYWFDYDYYNKNTDLSEGEFAFADGIYAREMMNRIRSEYSWFNRNDSNRNYAYVYAKVYKGVFIPTAIYFEGLKVIEFINN